MTTKELPPCDDPKRQRQREIQRAYRARVRDKRREWNNKWMMTNKDRFTFLRVQSNARRRRTVLLMYADPICCQKCGFDQIDGLVLDHIEDDGHLHRKELGISCRGDKGDGKVIYELIRRNGKIDKLQILCANCNTMKHIRRLRSNTLCGDAEKISAVERILNGRDSTSE